MSGLSGSKDKMSGSKDQMSTTSQTEIAPELLTGRVGNLTPVQTETLAALKTQL